MEIVAKVRYQRKYTLSKKTVARDKKKKKYYKLTKRLTHQGANKCKHIYTKKCPKVYEAISDRIERRKRDL